MIFAQRIAEADEFYAKFADGLSDDARNVQRQAFAGLMWSKQFYHYVVEEWLDGDPAMPEPPDSRIEGRNRKWRHLYNSDIISMPDKWEYPWYAAWDLAFHCIPLAMIDPAFAKEQLILMLREWYMHPNGQIPAYEWAFGDVNPPVHAWAALRVYQIEKKETGKADRKFLSRIFQKLLINFTWWINRKDADGHNVFEGGFLGLDNIGVFDRSQPLPTGGPPSSQSTAALRQASAKRVSASVTCSTGQDPPTSAAAISREAAVLARRRVRMNSACPAMSVDAETSASRPSNIFPGSPEKTLSASSSSRTISARRNGEPAAMTSRSS